MAVSIETSDPVAVIVHPSRFPGRARAAYLESFRSRRMNHQFLYDTEKQAQLWLAIHEAYSPARTDPECARTYREAFAALAGRLPAGDWTLVSLGCGGGQKDTALLGAIPAIQRYVPTDVSLTLALTAHLCAGARDIYSQPMVLDVAEARSLNHVLPDGGNRLFAFFGMLPNFEPQEALAPLAAVLRPQDLLIVSANLAPGPNYRAGVEHILPLYENGPTRRWLAGVLTDAGLEVASDDLEFQIAEASGLLRVEAGYRFKAEQLLRIDNEEFLFKTGEWFRLFFSYRHTAALLREQFAAHGLEVVQEWIAPGEDEGIFLGRKRVT